MTSRKQKDEYEDDGVKLPQKMVCKPGRHIFEQGTPAHQAFYIQEGRAEVVIRDGDFTMKLGELGPGEIFGEMGIIGNEMRMATVTALEPCTITVISRKELEERLKKIDDKIVRSLIDALVRRLRDASIGQLKHYKNMAAFQDRIGKLMKKAGDGVDPDRREEFTKEMMPLLEQMEKTLNKYRLKK